MLPFCHDSDVQTARGGGGGGVCTGQHLTICNRPLRRSRAKRLIHASSDGGRAQIESCHRRRHTNAAQDLDVAPRATEAYRCAVRKSAVTSAHQLSTLFCHRCSPGIVSLSFPIPCPDLSSHQLLPDVVGFYGHMCICRPSAPRAPQGVTAPCVAVSVPGVALRAPARFCPSD